MKTLIILFSLIASALQAGSRSSANYNVAADSADTGGRRIASASYTNDGSLGGIAGVSTFAAPAETVKQGYIAQLTEVTALQLAATPTTVNEAGTRRLRASLLNDDLTFTSLMPTSLSSWGMTGPLASIAIGGLGTGNPADAYAYVTADLVYENTSATVQASYGGNTGTLDLTVLDTLADNYGSYAGDGLGDDWQVRYFGLNNASAAPLLDPDHDGQSNLLEFATGQVPNAASVLSTQTKLNATLFEYTYPRSVAALNSGLQFTVEWSDTLSNDWQGTGVSETILSNDGTVQQVKATIPAGSGSRRFAHLKVTGPP